MTHTPGPWAWSYSSHAKHRLHLVSAATGAVIIEPHLEDSEQELISLQCSQANARLIAAAPELLAALKRIRGIADGSGAVSYILIAADTAIAEAEGQDS